MPVYEYECKSCGKAFEYQQRMADPDKTECEACGGALERMISRTAFQLKGGGWYKDLYSSTKPEAPAAKADAPAKSEGKSESKGDSGTAAPAAAAPAAAAPAAAAPAAAAPAAKTGTGTGKGTGTGSGGSST